MTDRAKEIYAEIIAKFEKLVEENELNTSEIEISSKGLTPEQAIGVTQRRDYPILTGKEVMLQAEYKGFKGQAFTSAPSDFKGTLAEIMCMDIYNDAHARGVYIAAINAVMAYIKGVKHTIHCKDDGPVLCSKKILEELSKSHHGKKVALIGYQPSIFEAMSKEFELRVLDLNPDNVGQERFGVIVEHGIDDYEDVVHNWADLVLCTGSVLCNATMDKYIEIGKEVIFFGTTIAGTAELLNLQRICPESL